MIKKLIQLLTLLKGNYRNTTIVKLPAGTADNPIVRTKNHDYVGYINNG